MNSASKHFLRYAELCGQPGVEPNTTWARYITFLKTASLRLRNNYKVSVNVFERWVRAKYDIDTPARVDEEMIEALRQDLQAGVLKSISGRALRSLSRQVPGCIFHLHNLGFGCHTEIKRRLIDARSHLRLKYFIRFTAITKKALTWFEDNGLRTSKRQSSIKQVMTTATRRSAVAEAFALLKALNMNGLEQVTNAHIAALLPSPDANNVEYRRMARKLHAAAAVYRSCVAEGLLPNNPLENMDNRIFSKQAERDFLPPAQVEKIYDCTNLDFNDWKQVRDRLTLLMFIDLAVRRNELASIKREQVKEIEPGKFQVILKSSGQKTSNKPTVALDILFPKTVELLKFYLDNIWPKYKTEGLIIDSKGNTASGQALVNIIKRAGTALNLQSYEKGKPPSCHALRRTFATCNAAPLGLKLNPQELAERLRTSIEIVYEHYVVQNPLLKTAKADIYRKRLEENDPVTEAVGHIDALANLDVPPELLAPIRAELKKRTHADTAESANNDLPPEWISETDAMAILKAAWMTIPRIRSLREYFAGKGAVKRAGAHGKLVYNAVHVKHCSDNYDPLMDHIKTMDKAARLIAERFDYIKIGVVRLIQRDDVVKLSKILNGHRDKGISREKIGKTDGQNLAKDDPKWSISAHYQAV